MQAVRTDFVTDFILAKGDICTGRFQQFDGLARVFDLNRFVQGAVGYKERFAFQRSTLHKRFRTDRNETGQYSGAPDPLGMQKGERIRQCPALAETHHVEPGGVEVIFY
jgi:hypothetical protein